MPIRRTRQRVTVIKPKVSTVKKPGIVRTVKQNIVNVPKTRDHMYSKIDTIWEDATVYIVGGGPSLKDFNWNLLKGKNVICVNRAFQVLPDADVLYWTDSRFYKWHKAEIDLFKGKKITCRTIPNPPADVTILKSNLARGFDDRPDYITHGNNSGFGAISLAVKMGATKIYLLGYDMNSNNRDTHWHNGYNIKHNHNIYTKMIQAFETLAPELSKRKIHVWNANPTSKLECFRKCSVQSAIGDDPLQTS